MALALLQKGARARIDGLTSRKALNGAEVELLSFHEASERWCIRDVQSGEAIRIKPGNLTRETASLRDRLGGDANDLLPIILAYLDSEMSLHAVAQTDAFNCRIATAVQASEAWKALRPARLYDAQADELFELMQEGYLRRIDRLLRHGARAPGVNMRNRVGMSVLHAVCFYRRDMVVADGGDSGVVDLVPHFVERGADVNAATIGGITPLMMLVYERSHLAEMFDLEQGAVVKKKMLDALLAAGADPNLRAGIGPKADIFCNGALSGKTALEIARAGKYPAVAAFIEAKMAEPVS